jgi:hypothetical protein
MRLFGAAVVAVCLFPMGLVAAEQNDLREFRVGMSVSELPATGYGGFSCIADPTKTLSDWTNYQMCPIAPDGTRAIGFRYGNGDEDEKTQVGGQAVRLGLLIGNDARVAAIKIGTDPQAKLYLRKKAHLFALQVRARFGEEGWTCQQTPPTPTEQPVGGVFVHEHCEKMTPTRHFLLDRALFRDPAKDLRDFTDTTQLTIRHAG